VSTRNLDKLFEPKSVVAIGASVRPGSVGEAVTRNLLAGGFKGDIHLAGRFCAASRNYRSRPTLPSS
jgi:acyl-CoA synthetase (NDP forming)